MSHDDNQRHCPVCDQPRPVLFYGYGWLMCQVCRAEFTIGESLKAAQAHALKTLHDVAAKVPR